MLEPPGAVHWHALEKLFGVCRALALKHHEAVEFIGAHGGHFASLRVNDLPELLAFGSVMRLVRHAKRNGPMGRIR